MPKKNETQLVCLAFFTAEKGKATQLIEKLHNLIPQTLIEGGCLRYELNQSIEDENDIVFVEKWYDQKTFDYHCNQPYITNFFNEGKPEFVASFQVKLYKEYLPI